MNEKSMKRVVMVENGEPKQLFRSSSDAARYLGVSATTITNRVKGKSIVKNVLLRYPMEGEDLSELPIIICEETIRSNRTRAPRKPSQPRESNNPTPFKSDDVELERDKYRILPYEVIYERICITPCPFKDPPKPKIGSVECMRCGSNKGRNKKTHEVACSRHYT